MGNLLFSGDNIFRDGCVGVIDAHHGSNLVDFIASLKRIRASDVDFLLPSHGPIFRKDDALLDATIARLESYTHMADFGTCAVDWPLLDQWEDELRRGQRTSNVIVRIGATMMSTALAGTTAATPSADLDPRPRRWTSEEFYRMAELGWFHAQRVELIEGEIMVLSPQGPSHSYLTDHVATSLRTSGWSGVWVRMQLPIDFGPYSDPEPDVSVVMGSRAGLPRSSSHLLRS